MSASVITDTACIIQVKFLFHIHVRQIIQYNISLLDVPDQKVDFVRQITLGLALLVQGNDKLA